MEPRQKRALTAEQADLLRQIPSVDELLAQPGLARLAERIDRNVLLEVTRTVLAEVRAKIAEESRLAVAALDPASLETRITEMVEQILSRSLQPVINATGVILHTNLGRAPLPRPPLRNFAAPPRSTAISNTISKPVLAASATFTPRSSWND